MNQKFCNSRSSDHLYTNGWSVDWGDMTCTQDCDPAQGPNCKAPTEMSDEIYSTVEQCCQKLSWQNQEYCVGVSTGASYATSYSHPTPKPTSVSLPLSFCV